MLFPASRVKSMGTGSLPTARPRQEGRPILFIRDNSGFTALADAARKTGILALDTEFMSGKTYYTKLCLVQASAGEISAIIDPLELEDLSPLVELLLDESILKVLHAAYQDIELMTRLCGRPPVPVFDTQVAATLADSSLKSAIPACWRSSSTSRSTSPNPTPTGPAVR